MEARRLYHPDEHNFLNHLDEIKRIIFLDNHLDHRSLYNIIYTHILEKYSASKYEMKKQTTSRII